MAEYEMIREIMNECSRNQMRDVFIDEIETDDPVEAVREMLKREAECRITAEVNNPERITVYADCSGLVQRFVFTRI